MTVKIRTVCTQVMGGDTRFCASSGDLRSRSRCSWSAGKKEMTQKTRKWARVDPQNEEIFLRSCVCPI